MSIKLIFSMEYNKNQRYTMNVTSCTKINVECTNTFGMKPHKFWSLCTILVKILRAFLQFFCPCFSFDKPPVFNIVTTISIIKFWRLPQNFAPVSVLKIWKTYGKDDRALMAPTYPVEAGIRSNVVPTACNLNKTRLEL